MHLVVGLWANIGTLDVLSESLPQYIPSKVVYLDLLILNPNTDIERLRKVAKRRTTGSDDGNIMQIDGLKICSCPGRISRRIV